MSEGLIRIAVAAKIAGVHPQTVRVAADSGVLPAYHSAGNRERRFLEQEVRRWAGLVTDTGVVRERVEAHYVRVSGSDQKGSLDTQAQVLADTATGRVGNVFRDVGSGLNDNRKGLNRLLDAAARGEFTVVRVVYADRLTRFGLKYLERVLQACDVTLEIVEDKRFKSSHDELMDDLLSLVASFSGKFYKMRSLANRQLVLRDAQNRLAEREPTT